MGVADGSCCEQQIGDRLSPTVPDAGDVEAANTCRVCGSAELTDLGPCRPYSPYTVQRLWPAGQEPKGSTGRLYRCRTCAVGLRHPCLSEDELAAFYLSMDGDYIDYDQSTNAAWTLARKCLLAQLRGADGPAVLDVGCFNGSFLRGLPPGWDRFGIEPSEAAGASAEQHGVQIIARFLGEPGAEWLNRFDAVCMFDVLEHLRDPRRALLAALRHLRPGGRLLVSTSNMAAWTWRWLGPDHWYLETPQHLTFGSPRFFQWFCRSAPAKLSRIQHTSHCLGLRRDSFRDLVAALYFGCRKRGRAWRPVQKAIQTVPAWRFLMHKTVMPALLHLRDHLFLEFEHVFGLRDVGASSHSAGSAIGRER